MFCQGCQDRVCKPNPGADQSAMELVGYCMSWKDMRDIYHNVYLLRRSLEFPPVENGKGEGQFRIYSPP